MKLYTKSGPIPFETFTFPDGQPHVKLGQTCPLGDHQEATLEMAIKSPADVFMVRMVSDVLLGSGYRPHRLDIRYLLGARMDRYMSRLEPFTLRIIVGTIGGAWREVRILDPHSDVSCNLLNAKKVLPDRVVNRILNGYDPERVVVVSPDEGARDRVNALLGFNGNHRLYYRVNASKVRDTSTGKLSGFAVANASILKGKVALILDDICDGGGTFVGLCKVLKEAGAAEVHLFVTHGIFSKSLPLEGIERIYTTDSYMDPRGQVFSNVLIYPVNMAEMA